MKKLQQLTDKIKVHFRLAGAVTALLLTVGTAVTTSTSVVHAAPKDAVCVGVNQGSGGGGCDGNGAEINKAVTSAITILTIIAGVAAVIMLIFGGIKYITSGGDSSSVASAKNTIIYSIIGLIVVGLAQIIVQFVLKSASEGGSSSGD